MTTTFTVAARRPEHDEHYEVDEVTYQRNGVSGEGFHVVRFRRVVPHPNPNPSAGTLTEVRLLGVVFTAPHHVAVLDPTDLTSHWRGGVFEPHLRAAVRAWPPTSAVSEEAAR